MPAAPPSLEQLRDRLEARPDLLALHRQAAAARLARRAGERGRIPDVRLGVGTQYTREGNREDWGVVLGVAVPLPLFDRGQAEAAKAQAAAQQAASEYQLALVKARGALRGLWGRTRRLQRMARRLEEETIPAARRLAETAQISYRAGELGILELVDAYRSLTQTRLRALELASEARSARIELDRLTGRGMP